MKLMLIFVWAAIVLVVGVGAQKANQAPFRAVKPAPLQLLKSQSVIIVEYDPSHETVTLNGPFLALDQWVCTRYAHGKSCKRASEVAMFILQDGQGKE